MGQAFEVVALGQAQFCRATGAPFSARVLEAVAADVRDGGPFADLLAPWADADPQRLLQDAVWLRLLGGLHDLSLEGVEPALTQVYPDGGAGLVDEAELSRRLAAALRRRRPRLARFMESPPQTNEVRRAVALQAGFREIARATGLPLSTLEIGASAGLLLNWDAFAYAAEDGSWRRGPADAALTIPTDWSGPPPPDADVRVVARAACDVAPIDVSDPVQRRRLAAYVWADQADRLERLGGAIEVARARDVEVEAADAADWLPGRLAPQEGVVTVLYHSVMFQYVPPASRETILRTLARASASATDAAPVAWLRLEPPSGDVVTPAMELTLTLWPSGQERLLATVHPHGASVTWLGADPAGAGARSAG